MNSRLQHGLAVVVAVLSITGTIAHADCALTNTGVTPLNELGLNSYQGLSGGLYPNGANSRPSAHETAGLEIATSQILPLDATGNVDTNNGKIVLLSLGMSNTSMEWANGFKPLAENDPSRNPQLSIVDGAIGGQEATRWTNANAAAWDLVITQRLVQAGVTTNQVQAMWLKQALGGPANFGAFPLHAQALKNDLALILRFAKAKYPNLKLVYISCRTRAYTSESNTLNPEPFAFETSFADKWVIEDQINGSNDLNFNPSNGPVVAPWLSWGPYLWADGLSPRSDGFVWECQDVGADFTHPSSSGRTKVARQLLAFFKTDPTTSPWFLRKTVIDQPPVCEPSADVTNGTTPLAVQFDANAADPDGTIRDYQWTFDDGTFATNSSPVKTFKSHGIYTTRVTVTDNDGNTVTRSLPVKVAAVALGGALFITNQFQFTVLGSSDYDYVGFRSEDLAGWLPVATNRGPFIFTETNPFAPRRYFRALVQP